MDRKDCKREVNIPSERFFCLNLKDIVGIESVQSMFQSYSTLIYKTPSEIIKKFTEHTEKLTR